MKVLLVAAAVVLLAQIASAGPQFIDPEPYTLRCRLCDPNPGAPKNEAHPVMVNIPASDGWIKTLAVLLLGSTLTLLIQRLLKTWEMRFAFLREAMEIGRRLDSAALKFLKASVNITMLQERYPQPTPKNSRDVIAAVIAPGAMEIAQQRNIMTEARSELSAVLFEAVNLLVPMPVLFGKRVQNLYLTAINCYAIERHGFAPSKLRNSVRQFHEEWKRFNARAALACGRLYRRTKATIRVFTKEEQELLERILRGADEVGKKEGEK